MSLRLGLLLAAVALGGSGCGGSAATVNSAQDAYARGVAALDRGKCARATEHFKTTLDFGRTSELAADAQLSLARAYACDKQYLLAGSEFTRFIEFYRADPRIEDAAFERIQAYAALSPRYELDQTDTHQAINYIRLYLQQYPDSPKAGEAQAILDRLREKLAHKDYETGRLYEVRELYEAAVMTYQGVLEDYPTSAYADDTLLGALRAQVLYAENSVPARQAERYRAAVRFYEQLVSLFPGSPLLREAETEHERALRGLQAVEAVAGTPAAN